MSSAGRLFMDLRSSSITGEATDAEFPDNVELNGWDWDLARPDRADSETAAVRAAAEPSVFRFSKRMDKSTPQLLSRLMSKEGMNARLKLVGVPGLPFGLVVELKRVRIVEYSVDGDDEEKSGEVKETWTFNYDEISFEHSSASVKGTLDTITSNPLRRSADASTDKPDPVNKVVSGFVGLTTLAEKKDAAKEMNRKSPDAFKGLTS